MASEAELDCQNPDMSFVGKGGIRQEGKLQDNCPFAEGLHEAEQNSKNDACQHWATQAELCAGDSRNKQLTQFFFHRIHHLKGEKKSK